MKIIRLIKPWMFGLFILGLVQSGNTQIISGTSAHESADSLISRLHEGYLVVPLMQNTQKIKLLEKWVTNDSLDKKTRAKMEARLAEEMQKLHAFNNSLIKNFNEHFDFCKVVFVESDQLTGFNTNEAIFLDPETRRPDPSIRIDDEPYFFLRYYKPRGIATQADDVRYFYIADQDFNVLQRPFPNSPDRQTSFKLRFRDLVSLSLETDEIIEILVTKLNEQLFRYLNR